MSVDRAKTILLDRVPVELSMAEQSAAQYIVIGKHSNEINGSKYRHLFSYVQNNALSSLILSLGKVYEPSSQRYPNFGIPTAIAELQASLSEISALQLPLFRLTEFLASQSVALPANPLDPTAVVSCLLEYFADKCPRDRRDPPSDLDRNYIAVRVVRDKRVAHLEDHDLAGLEKTSLEEIKKLIAFGYTAVNMLGYGLFGFSQKTHIHESEIDYESTIAALELQKMIEDLHI